MATGACKFLATGHFGRGRFGSSASLYADSSYALISVDPGTGEAWFRLYGEQKTAPPSGAGEATAASLSHSVARIRLF